MLRRLFWLFLGIGVGLGSSFWVTRRVKQAAARYAPRARVERPRRAPCSGFGHDLRLAVARGPRGDASSARPSSAPTLPAAARLTPPQPPPGPRSDPPVGWTAHGRGHAAAHLERVLRGSSAHARALGQPDPHPSHRPDVHQLGDDAVRPVLPRRGAGALRPAPGVVDPEVRAPGRQAQRHRRDRPHPPPPHLLRDARQLELRRVLPARGHQVGVGAGAGGRVRRRPHLAHRPPHRRRRRGDLARGDRDPDGADPAPRQGQLLGDGRDRPLRSVLGDPLRLRPRVGRRGRARPRRRRPLHRVLEPRVHAATSATPTARSAALPAQNVDTGAGFERWLMLLQDVRIGDRHRHHAAAPRHRPVDHRPHLRRTRPRTTTPCASWPTTPAR